MEARITHLAYAPEIAQAMLVRQQAAQVVAARTHIVESAVGMVGLALERLAEQGVVELDEERKAQMVSNLLVVLCGDRATQPVVNAGSLYAGHAGKKEAPAAARSGRLRGRGQMGGRRSAQRQRTDRVRLAPRAQTRGARAETVGRGGRRRRTRAGRRRSAGARLGRLAELPPARAFTARDHGR